MITHFFSDPHFGHRNIVGFCERPFSSVGAMNAQILQNYHNMVISGDTVCWTGDAFFARGRGDRALWRAELRALPGRKILVRGNHDGTVARCLDYGFDLVVDVLYLQILGQKVTVCHYPPANDASGDDRYLDRRPPKPKAGEVLIHGHSHSPKRVNGRSIHVGVDAWDYRPVPLSCIQDLVTQMKGDV